MAEDFEVWLKGERGEDLVFGLEGEMRCGLLKAE
jgi:hypothetical protein